MQAQFSLFIGNDTLVRVTGLQNASNNAFVGDATVVATIEDDDFTVLATVPLVVSDAPRGHYEGTLPFNALALQLNKAYWLHVVASGDYRGDWRERVTALYRS